MEGTLSSMPMSSVLVRNRIGGSTTVFLPSTTALNMGQKQVKERKQENPHKKQHIIGKDDYEEKKQQQQQQHANVYPNRNSFHSSNYSSTFRYTNTDEGNKVEHNPKSVSSLVPSSSSLLLCSTTTPRSSSSPSSVQSAINVTTANTAYTNNTLLPSNTSTTQINAVSSAKPEYNSHVLTIQVKTEKEVIRKEIQSEVNYNYNNIESVHNQSAASTVGQLHPKVPQSSKISFISTVGLSPSETLTTKASNKSLIKIEQTDSSDSQQIAKLLNKQTPVETNDEMVQKSDLDVNQQYYYYMMPSGQCSPSDTLDSGTCSDLEVSPPPLPKKMSPTSKYLHSSHHLNYHHNNKKETEKQNNTKNNNGKMMVEVTKTTPAEAATAPSMKSNGSLSDSDESQLSSCDSLNGSEKEDMMTINNGLVIKTATPPPPPPPQQPPLNESIKEQKPLAIICLPDSLLKDIRERSNKLTHIAPISPSSSITSLASTPTSTPTPTPSSPSLSPVPTPTPHHQFELRSYKPRMTVRDQIVSPSVFENDRFYNFHINEHIIHEDPLGKPAKIDIDDAFAGYKDINNGTSTIRSNKGTIRGVKNRVRNGIATFLQMQHTSIKNYKEKDSGKVVVYTTSMGILRDTYAKCVNIKNILRTLLVKFEERDVFMSREYQLEIKDRMQSDNIIVPQLFVDGQHIGDADCVERLNETGELRKMLKQYKCLDPSYTCQICGGYRLLPCPSCNGSKKSVHRNHFTAEFIALKCMNCDEVGLVKCYNC